MDIVVDDIPGGVKIVRLNGRLDIAGAAAIDMRMSLLAGSSRAVAVDLTNVSFLASMGIRTLLVTAKSISSKGGKMVCFGANHDVASVIETSGISMVLPLKADLDAAVAAVTS
jgi:anti-anti-sigma factor